MHQLQFHQGQLQEIYVALAQPPAQQQQIFTEIKAEVSTPRLIEYFALIGIDPTQPDYPEEYRTEVNLVALDWLASVAERLRQGYCLTIDYGYTAAQYYSPARSQGTLQCYSQHAVGNNPYLQIGYQDLTAHVNFTALERQGELCGLETLGLIQQGMFLMALGLGDRLVANNTATNVTDLNKIIRRREALQQLINPLGLGGFKVLIQSKGLSPTPNQPLKGLPVV